MVDFSQLDPQQHVVNLQNAFDVAERELGIAPLLDAEDIDTVRPDEKSVITYVASFYHTFARMKNEMKGGRRIANVIVAASLLHSSLALLFYCIFLLISSFIYLFYSFFLFFLFIFFVHLIIN